MLPIICSTNNPFDQLSVNYKYLIVVTIFIDVANIPVDQLSFRPKSSTKIPSTKNPSTNIPLTHLEDCLKDFRLSLKKRIEL